MLEMPAGHQYAVRAVLKTQKSSNLQIPPWHLFPKESDIIAKHPHFLKPPHFTSANSTMGFLYIGLYFFSLQRNNLYHCIKILYKLSPE